MTRRDTALIFSSALLSSYGTIEVIRRSHLRLVREQAPWRLSTRDLQHEQHRLLDGSDSERLEQAETALRMRGLSQ